MILCIYTRSSRDVMRNWFVQVTNNSRRNGNASYILGILSIWHNDDDDDTTTTNTMQSNSAGRREWGKKVTSAPTTTITHTHTHIHAQLHRILSRWNAFVLIASLKITTTTINETTIMVINIRNVVLLCATEYEFSETKTKKKKSTKTTTTTWKIHGMNETRNNKQREKRVNMFEESCWNKKANLASSRVHLPRAHTQRDE